MKMLAAEILFLACIFPSVFIGGNETPGSRTAGIPDNTIETAENVRRDISSKILSYMSANDFIASQSGILVGNKLVYAEANGQLDELSLQTNTLIPILDLSKAITAVAILQLVEDGSIQLNESVFCPGCLLQDFLPAEGISVRDPRLYNITIEHLLLHKAGWDESQGRLLDPMMNTLLLSLEYNVPNIRADVGPDAEEYFDQYTIIQYMIGQNLNFSPGSKVAHSNLGYSILGRVIEAATGKDYEAYVRKNILEVSGMYYTKIGTSSKEIIDAVKQKYVHRRRHGNVIDNGVSGQVSSYMLDSTLGWYSNVYDVARFFVALFENDEELLLQRSTLTRAIANIPELALYHQFPWQGLRLNIPNYRALHQEQSARSRDVSVYFYREPGFGLQSAQGVNNVKTYIFIGFTSQYRQQIQALGSDTLNINLTNLRENEFMNELDGEILRRNSEVSLLKTDLRSDVLVGYSNALKHVGFHPLWIYGYSYQQQSLFVVLFVKANAPGQLEHIIASSTSKTKIWRFVADYSRHSYQVTYVQSFISASHSNKLQHLVIMKRPPSPKVVMFGFHKRMGLYNQTLRYAMAEGYRPVVQSIQKHASRKFVSFVLQKPHPLTKHYNELSLEELINTTRLNVATKYYLSYLDVRHSGRGMPRFSVIFTQKGRSVGSILQTNISKPDLSTECQSKASSGYLPSLIVPYNRHQSLKFLVYWQRSH